MSKLKVLILALVSYCCALPLQGQTQYEYFESRKLGQTREIKIQLPRNYDDDDGKVYPLFVVLDGDYLFEIVGGNVDYFSYWEDMPQAVVVGINQADYRNDDFLYSEQNSLPIESGAAFFEFITMELMPHLMSEYRIAPFKVVVGHGESANYMNFFLLKDNPIFQGYICISPILGYDMQDYLTQRVGTLSTKIFYHLSCGENDLKPAVEDAKALNEALAAMDNKQFYYDFLQSEASSHYTNAAKAVPNALEQIFFPFQPISKSEYQDYILTLESSPVEYLEEKYKTINELFGLKKTILVNDFKAIEAAIKKKEQYEYFEALGKLAREAYPEALLGHYYLGRYYEEAGQPKKAMRTYQSAYILEELGGITKDEMMDRANAIKRDFGY